MNVKHRLYKWTYSNIVHLGTPYITHISQLRIPGITTDLNYWIKLLSCIIEANGGHIGLSHINLHWHY